jgi:signal transduction histidine kinase
MHAPVNIIAGLTDLMLNEYESVNVKETLKEINTAGHALKGLISDVLDISKIEDGKLELMPVQYDAAGLVNDIDTSNITRIGEKPVTFKLDINENLPVNLFGDNVRVKQILNNLLSNAFKYTKMGTITLQIKNEKLKMKNEEEPSTVFVTFTVSDTGIGIRRDDIAKLFSDRATEGTGLGLSLTKKFVEMMAGELTVESEYGKGSTFRVRIRQGFVTDTPIGKETAERLRKLRN